MKTTKVLLALTIASQPFTWSLAQAQDAAALPEVVAEGEVVQAPAQLGTGIDSGTTTLDRQDIEMRTPGSGDVNQLLKIAPTVQFGRSEGIASRDNIQDLRPSDIAISGGLSYQNNISLDGINVSSRLDVTNTNAQNGSELAGATAQGLWLDAELIGKITLRDSNVSAEYGRFTGGALEIETRDPRGVLGVTGSFSHTSDDLTHMKLSDLSREAIGDEPRPEKPVFEKWRYGATVDVPVTQNGALLLGYNRNEATVVHRTNSAYGNAARSFRSTSENVLVRGTYDIDAGTKLRGQFTYSPYSSESSTAAAIDAMVTSKSGGYAGKVELDHQGPVNWLLRATYSRTDTGRTAPHVQYNIPSTVENGAFCTSSTCTVGGIGRLDQTEESYGLKAKLETDLGVLRFNAGLNYDHSSVVKARPDDLFAYSRGVTGASIRCADGDDLTCVSGQYALEQYNLSPAYRAEITIDEVAAWVEGTAEIGLVRARVGMRYEYESFLGNHVFAPRLSIAYALPWDGWDISAGANRYYGGSMVSYAVREQYPSSEIHRRAAIVSGGLRTYSDAGWGVSSISNANGYSNSDLKTPYADELTAALTGRVLGGTMRLKGIYRDGKNDFVRSPMQTMVEDNGSGGTITRRYYEMTNEGTSSYRSVSLEWGRSFGKHAISASVQFEKTKTRHTTYFEDVDDSVFDSIPVLFEGNVVSSAEIANTNRRGDFAGPMKASITWSAKWLDDRLRSSLSGNYRDGFRRIENTDISRRLDGVLYDVFAWKTYSSSFDADLNVQADLIQSRFGTLSIDVRIANLLDSVPVRDYVSIADYQFGRSAWFGVKFRY